MAWGFNRQPDVDSDETFSPVVKTTLLFAVLTIVVSCHWPSHQLDVANAFLHVRPYHACRFHKALYGLKQAPGLGFSAMLLISAPWDFLPANHTPRSLFTPLVR